MFISGTVNLDAFYDVGVVCDYPDTQYCNSVQESGRSDKNGNITIEPGEYNIYLQSKRKLRGINYLYLNVSEINRDSIDITIELYSEETSEKPEFVGEYVLVEGKNHLDVSGVSFQKIHIVIKEQGSLKFTLNSVQSREKKNLFSKTRFLHCFSIIFIMYIGVCVMIRVCTKRYAGSNRSFGIYFIVDILQNLYINIGESLYSFIPEFIKKRRNILTTFLFSIIMLYMTIIDNANLYQRYFKYNMLIYAFVLIIIAVIHCENKLVKINWRTPLGLSWFSFWVIVCLSDFKVTKRYQFAGYLGLFAIGFVIFVMNNERKQMIVQCFKNAVHIYYLACLGFCVLFRPLGEEVRYIGFSWNPGIFAICLVTVLAVTLTELDNYALGYISKRKAFFHVLELGSICLFLALSQAVGPFLVGGLIILLWLIRFRHLCLNGGSGNISFGKNVCLFVIGGIAAAAATYVGVRYIPVILKNNFIMERDLYHACIDMRVTLPVQASDIRDYITNSRIYEKFYGLSLTKILSGRNFYYKGYLRQMNLWGHFKNASVFGGSKLPHNALIGIAFRYGVFAVIPYFLMLVYTIKNTFLKIFENRENSFLPFGVCFTGIMMSMADNVEYPFMWCTWLGIYLMMGVGFGEKEEEMANTKE